MEKHANFHIHGVHRLVSCNFAFIIVFRALKAPQNFLLFEYDNLYVFTHVS
jgi:hypothetical protein